MMDDEDRCGSGEDDHEVLVKIEFDTSESDDGVIHCGSATIHSHVHNVPPEAAAQTLVMVAHKILAEHMAHTMFETCSDHTVAHAMADAAAAAMLAATASQIPGKAEMIPLEVPDDISSLIEGD